MIEFVAKVIISILIVHSFYRVYNALSLQVLYLVLKQSPFNKKLFRLQLNKHVLFKEQRKQTWYAIISLLLSFFIVVVLALYQ